MRSSWIPLMKVALRGLAGLLALAIAGYFIWFALHTFKARDLVPLFHPEVIAAILLASCLYALIIPFSGFAWSALLRRQGEEWSTAHLASILAVAQIAKYIPGGIAQPVGRAALSMHRGMALRAFAVTAIQEAVLAMGASVVVGAVLLWLSPSGFGQLPSVYRDIVYAGLVAMAASVLYLARGAILLRWWNPAHRWLSALLDLARASPGTSTTLAALFVYCFNYLVAGSGIWIVGQALDLSAAGNYALLTAAFSLGWLLGFVTPGAPAGLGVREGVMTLLLSHSLPQHQILALVVATRLVTVTGDGLCFALGCWALRSRYKETE
jgi:hypothetical protein